MFISRWSSRLPLLLRASEPMLCPGGASSAQQLSTREYRSLQDPAVELNFYRSQDGAPVGARNTAAGARAIERSIVRDIARRLRVSLNPGGPNIPEDARVPGLGPEGIVNFGNVRLALAQHFHGTVGTILAGQKPVGIGGDHSMAAATLRGAVLAISVRELLRAAAGGPGADARLVLGGPRAAWLRSAFAEAAAARDVGTLGLLLDLALSSGALSSDAFDAFKMRFGVPWVDAHFDWNKPALGGETRVEHDPERPSWPRRIEAPSPSGNYHGMPALTVCGFGPKEVTEYVSKSLSLSPDCFGFVAVRDGDASEHEVLERLGVVSFDMGDVRKMGVDGCLHALVRLAETRSRKVDGLPPFVLPEIDIDAIDAWFVPGTGTPVGRGSQRNPAEGPSLRSFLAAMRGLVRHPFVEGLDLAENAHVPDDPRDPTLATGQAVLAALLDLSASQRAAFFEAGAQGSR